MKRMTVVVLLSILLGIILNIPSTTIYITPERVYAKTVDEEIGCSGNKEELVWLARIVYSENQQDTSEYTSIAWTVRERVETGYKGSSYEEVATAPYQYSGLIPGLPENEQNLSLSLDTSLLSDDEHLGNWETAIEVAQEVCNAPTSHNPFPKHTRHFYNHQIKTPFWAKDADGCEVHSSTLTVCWGVR